MGALSVQSRITEYPDSKERALDAVRGVVWVNIVSEALRLNVAEISTESPDAAR